MDATGPNAQQIQYWNETAGPKWVTLQSPIDDQIRPLARFAMDRAALLPGERVLDIGCGCGDTTIELASRVAPGGAGTGIDISAVMLERGTQVGARPPFEPQIARGTVHIPIVARRIARAEIRPRSARDTPSIQNDNAGVGTARTAHWTLPTSMVTVSYV